MSYQYAVRDLIVAKRQFFTVNLRTGKVLPVYPSGKIENGVFTFSTENGESFPKRLRCDCDRLFRTKEQAERFVEIKKSRAKKTKR